MKVKFVTKAQNKPKAPKVTASATSTKLTVRDVDEIRRRYANGNGERQVDLAKVFKVNQSTISDIVRYHIYKDRALRDHSKLHANYEKCLTAQANVISGLKSENTKLNQKVVNQSKLLTKQKAELLALSQSFTSLETDLGANDKRIAKLEQQRIELETRINELENSNG